ncbi:MAG: DUF2807 domain-containing protein, partial [Draconibacterium sp.]|nr:DUF2807 domain-containing protein [Draconibacterium sp.]
LSKGYHIAQLGGEPSVFDGWKFELTPARGTLLAYNKNGEYQWSFSLRKLGSIGKARPRPRTFGNFVMAHGNHLVFVFGAYAFVLDASERRTEPVPLWEMDLVYFTENQKKSEGFLVTNLSFSLNGQIYSYSSNRRGGLIKGKVVAAFGSITDHSITYFNNETLFCRNLQTGEIIWQHKVGYGEMTLFTKQIGKRKGVFLLQKKGRKYYLHQYQALNGSHVKTIELKNNALRVVRVFNNKILSIYDSETDPKMITVQLYDPVSEQAIWKREYAKEFVSLRNSRLSIYPLGHDELSVIQNNGHIQVLSLLDGQLKLDVNIGVLDVSVSAGSNIKLEGRAKYFTGKATSGSNLKAEDLKTKDCSVNVSSGANIWITAKNNFNAHASSGGNIFYYGNPESTEIEKSSGGNIIEK